MPYPKALAMTQAGERIPKTWADVEPSATVSWGENKICLFMKRATLVWAKFFAVIRQKCDYEFNVIKVLT